MRPAALISGFNLTDVVIEGALAEHCRISLACHWLWGFELKNWLQQTFTLQCRSSGSFCPCSFQVIPSVGQAIERHLSCAWQAKRWVTATRRSMGRVNGGGRSSAVGLCPLGGAVVEVVERHGGTDQYENTQTI